jgi:hypothetical protein
VLNELDGIINGCDSFIVLAILPNPDIMLGVSVCFFRGKGFLVGLNVFNCLPDIILGFCEGVGVIISHLGVSGNLGCVIVDGIIQIIEDSVTGADISSSNLIVLLLVFVQASDDFVEEHVHLVG